jgi:hypothetical protein
MDFATPADATNAVAAALTVMLRNHFAGAKPLLAVTATKSHAGKETVVSFAAGNCRTVSVSYQLTDWALERSVVAALKTSPEAAIVDVENARLGTRARFIASAFLERFVTDPEPFLFSTGSGGPTQRRNDIVIAITTNFGSLSQDLMNRALPIHLTPLGDVANRQSAIGNARHEFLPANRKQIEAELHGMIARWKDAGCPLADVRHSFSRWAATIGGILEVCGFAEFLANYSMRRTADDPVRHALGLLAVASPDIWLQSRQWATLAVDLGLVATVIPHADRNSEKGRERGMGVVLSAHQDETFRGETEGERVTARLEKARRRFDGGDPSTRYRFSVLDRERIPEDAMD